MASGHAFAFASMWDEERRQTLGIEAWKTDGRPDEYRPILSMSVGDRVVHAVIGAEIGPLIDPLVGSEVVGYRFEEK